MIAIPNMDMPKKGEVIAFDGEYAVYTDDRMNVHRYPLIEIDLVRCEECKWCDDKGKKRALICTNPYIDMDIHPLDFCSYGEPRGSEYVAKD